MIRFGQPPPSLASIALVAIAASTKGTGNDASSLNGARAVSAN